MYIATIKQKYGGKVQLGPTDSRDEAARLARAWIEAHAGIIAPTVGQPDPVCDVHIERTDEEE